MLHGLRILLLMALAWIGAVLPLDSFAQSSKECFSVMLVVNGKPFRSPPAVTVIFPNKHGEMALDPQYMFEVEPEPDGRFCLPKQSAGHSRFGLTFILSDERFLIPDQPKKDTLDTDWSISFKTSERACDVTYSRNGKPIENVNIDPCIIDAN